MGRVATASPPLLLWHHVSLDRAELSVSLMTRRTPQRLLKFQASRVQLERGLSRVSPFKCDSAEVSWPWSHVRIRVLFNGLVPYEEAQTSESRTAKFRCTSETHLLDYALAIVRYEVRSHFEHVREISVLGGTNPGETKKEQVHNTLRHF